MYHIIVNPSAKTGLGRAKWQRTEKNTGQQKKSLTLYILQNRRRIPAAIHVLLLTRVFINIMPFPIKYLSLAATAL